MIVIIFLIKGNGSSTGIIPNQVRIKKDIKNGQNINGVEDILLFCIFFGFNLRGIKIKIDITRAITPPNLFGIDRKIA
jgi:hypothetical protein